MTSAGDSVDVRGIVLPTGVADVLLPNSAVAEILGYHEPRPYPSAPGWLLGAVSWRGCEIPLVSLAAADTEVPANNRVQLGRMVICYTPSGNSALPYVGILALAPPRLARLSASKLEPAQTTSGNPFVLHAVTYAGRSAWIPDMDAIEAAILEAITP